MLINIYRFFVYATSKITTTTSLPDLIGESRKHWIVRSSQTMTNYLIPMSLCIVVLILCVSSIAHSSSDWKATLKVSGGGIYSYCIFGVKDEAIDERDNDWDVPAPPGSPNEMYIYTYFPHPEWGGTFERFRQDIKAPDLPKEWIFEVSSNVSGGLTIQWSDLKNAIPDKEAVLVDIDGGGSEIDMQTSSSFIFVNSGNPRRFLVRISETEIISVPNPPAYLVGKSRKGKVVLYWKKNKEIDLAGYNIYRSTTSGSGYQRINSSLISINKYVDGQLIKDNTYYYVVTAVNTEGGESGYSNEVAVIAK